MPQHPSKLQPNAPAPEEEQEAAYLRPRQLVRFSPRLENHSKTRLWALDHPRVRPAAEGSESWLSTVTGWLKR